MFFKLSKQLLTKRALLVLVFLQLSIVFLISLLTAIWSLQEAAWGIIEIILTFWTMVVFILITQKFYNQNIVDRLELVSLKRYRLQLSIFLYVFIFGLIVIFSCLAWTWVFSHFEDNYNIFHVDFFTLINWKNIKYGYYSFLIIFELLLIIGFVFFINSVFNKHTNFTLMLTVFTIVYLIRFGNIWEHNLLFREFDNFLYPVWKSSNAKNTMIINSIILPWNTLGVWGTNLYRYSGAEYAMKFLDTTHINSRADLGLYLNNSYWIPILWIPIYLSMGTTINFLRRNHQT